MKKKSKTNRTSARKAAVTAAPAPTRVIEVPSTAAGLRETIQLIGDGAKPAQDRYDALQAVQAASFGTIEFDAVRAEYLQALRQMASDPDQEMRQRALGILARENDSFANKALLDGLRNEKKALLPPIKALQLLAYNPHSGAYTAARETFAKSADDAVKKQALRLMSGDPESAKLIEKTLADKKQSAEVRRMSAAALHTMNPRSLQNWANKAMLDRDEDNDVIATCMTAIHQFGDEKAIAGNKALQKRVKEMQAKAPAKVKKLAKSLATKYGL